MKNAWTTQDSAELAIYNPVTTAAPLVLPKGMFTANNGDARVNSAGQKLYELGGDSDLW